MPPSWPVKVESLSRAIANDAFSTPTYDIQLKVTIMLKRSTKISNGSLCFIESCENEKRFLVVSISIVLPANYL
jgi:hypothetical protein